MYESYRLPLGKHIAPMKASRLTLPQARFQ